MSDDRPDPSKFRWRRALVRAGRTERASSGLRDRVFALDPAAIAAGATMASVAKSAQAASRVVRTPPSASPPITTSSGASALVWKSAALFFLAGVSVGATMVTLRTEARAPSPRTSVADVTTVAPSPSTETETSASDGPLAASEEKAPPALEASRPSPAASATDTTHAKAALPLDHRSAKHIATSATTVAQASESRRSNHRPINDEMRAVEAIRAAANDGRPSEALRLVEAYRAAFPSGMLAEEADVMHIEALSRLGRSTAAAELARRFLKTRSDSPYVERVEETLHSLEP